MDTITGAALDIGGTTTTLLVNGPSLQQPYMSETPTSNFSSLVGLIERKHQEAQAATGGMLQFLAIGISGPVNRLTKEVALTNAKSLAKQTLRVAQLESLGARVHALNNVRASGLMLLDIEALQTQLLRGSPAPETPSYLLLEIGTGLGTAYVMRGIDTPYGEVIASALQHSHSVFGFSFERLLAGASGFQELFSLAGHMQTMPEVLLQAIELEADLGPAITSYLLENPESPFATTFLGLYGSVLGEYARTAQLAFSESTHLFIGGGIGRIPGFLELALTTPEFTSEFVGERYIQGDVRATMGISRIQDTDLTVRGLYTYGRHIWHR